MVYKWQDYRDVCYQMYITEGKSLEEIMRYMSNTHNFAPSKRAFQTKFRSWDFPSKQNPAHQNPALVARTQQLWNTNTSQPEMLRILNEEGFHISQRELMRLRNKYGWLLRVPNGMKDASTRDSDFSELPTLDSALPEDVSPPADLPRAPTPPLPPQILAKRKERADQMKVESDQRWSERKRRRRTRGWAGLPADPPGPPRFPSETTLEESKTYLSLTAPLYHDVREHFQRICDESGIIKKTTAGPEKWQQAKDQLIRENVHLQSVFWQDTTQLELKALALDVVATDVTKRMRTIERRMTLAEAKNTLGLNPEESRQVRNAFYRTLRADHFTSKLEAGEEHWQELKEEWLQQQPKLLENLAPGDADPDHAPKVKAVEVLARDVMKRLRDDQYTRLDKPQASKPKPSPRAAPASKKAPTRAARATNNGVTKGISKIASKALASTPAVAPNDSTTAVAVDDSNFQIDPSLLQAANDPSFAAHGAVPSNSFGLDGSAVASTQSTPDAVYLRPHPTSTVYSTAKVWLGKLNTRTVGELRNLLAGKWPNTSFTRIEGIEKGPAGQEIAYLVEEDDELDAYLTHVEGRKATFVALMNQA